MARIAKSEAEILALGQPVATGLAANAAIYPAPPVSVIDLGTALNGYITARKAAKNGNTVSSPSTKPAKANPATPSWPCCRGK